MKIIIVAGGTGGHIYPGIAIAQAIREKSAQTEILFLGSREGLEKKIVPRYGFDLKLISSRALLRKISYKAITAPFVTFLGFVQALLIIKKFRPNYLVSTGGFASLPVCLAAWVLKVPIILQEQNVLPGLVNRFCARFARKVFFSFAQTSQYLKGQYVGNPIRKKIAGVKKQIRQELKTLLVMGGSQGSLNINKVVSSVAPKIPSDLKVIHLVGARDFPWLEKFATSNYQPLCYVEDVAQLFEQADLVVSRAGATAIAEFLAVGLPMVLIPFPYASENHQYLNALAVADAGAAIIINDQDFNPQSFLSLLSNSNLTYAKMAQAAKLLAKLDAAERIVDFLHV